MSSLSIGKGERAVIIGSTGSGKTQMLLAQIRHYEYAPIIIMDTKGDAGIAEYVLRETQAKNAVTIDSVEKLLKQIKLSSKADSSEIIHVMPPPLELNDPETLDGYLQAIYSANKSCLVCIDEAYMFHQGGRAFGGLIGLLTRGRSKGMSLICCTQRPAWLSRFIFSESQHFFVYRLQDARDRKALRDMGLPWGKDKASPPKYHFSYYYNGDESFQDFMPIKLEYDPGYAPSVSITKARFI